MYPSFAYQEIHLFLCIVYFPVDLNYLVGIVENKLSIWDYYSYHEVLCINQSINHSFYIT